jgi:CubicO group peptidase (beta-lactamase class C family)
MEPWLQAAIGVIPGWIAFQMRARQQVGCLLAIAHRGEVVLEQGFGLADLATGEAMTPRHRFRVASHTKSLTAAGILRLREAGRIGLDDPVGRYVPGLHPDVAAATIGQLLSHSAGLLRDGADSGYFSDTRPFPDGAEVRAALAGPQPLEAGVRLKYSNFGYALLGQVAEAVTGQPWDAWIRSAVIEPFGLAETAPDMPLPPGTGPDTGRIVLTGGYGSQGEPARLIRDAEGRVVEVRLGAGVGRPEAVAAAEIAARYPRG